MFNEAQAAAFWEYEETLSMKELKRQLHDGLIGSTEFARAALDVWDNFRALPQNRHLDLPKQ